MWTRFSSASIGMWQERRCNDDMRVHVNLTRVRSVAFASLVAVLFTGVVGQAAGAQTRRAEGRSSEGRAASPIDSTSLSCLNITWLDPSAVCNGRVSNTASLALLGGMAGGLAGAVGGAISPSSCFGNYETAAARGAAMGAGAGLVTSLLVRTVSRRQLAANNAAQREEAQRHPVRPWSWRDVKPAFVVVGTTALAGAVLGAAHGARSPACTGGAGANALRGAGVYGGGTMATIGGSLLVVRFLC